MFRHLFLLALLAIISTRSSMAGVIFGRNVLPTADQIAQYTTPHDHHRSARAGDYVATSATPGAAYQTTSEYSEGGYPETGYEKDHQTPYYGPPAYTTTTTTYPPPTTYKNIWKLKDKSLWLHLGGALKVAGAFVLGALISPFTLFAKHIQPVVPEYPQPPPQPSGYY